MSDDTISRRAAANEMQRFLGYLDQDMINRLKIVINRLPSAEPEVTRCKDCDWWAKREDSLQGRCALMRLYPTGAWYCANAKKRGDV